MRPILMKGHERPLTFLKYNLDGDILFSCAKDHTPTVWFADNGERLGTYRGHNGAVWCCDVSRDSMRLITGSADQSVKLWNVQTGEQLYSFNFGSPARAVDFAVGDKLAVITTDPFMDSPSAIHVKQISRDPSDQTGESVLTIKGPQGRINRAVWGPLNKTLISAGEDAVVRIWDSETGKLLKESDKESGHKKTVTSLSKSADGSHFLTGSLDKSAKLWDIRTLTLIKTYVTERPVNAVTMSPLLDHDVFPEAMLGGLSLISGIEHQIDFIPGAIIPNRPAYMSNSEKTNELQRQVKDLMSKWYVRESMSLCAIPVLLVPKKNMTWRMCVDCRVVNNIMVVLGGGQDASHVTTTDHRAGKFEAKFFDKILQEEIGGVKGHFGPINALAFNPDGKSFSSGGEDGYVRLHHFDSDYFNVKI
ncbi:hypothetical protein I3843_16G073200 [Carya illinoinensis]|nr:hypothetical protein I3843_16G073200 [Carya illinoinensis]